MNAMANARNPSIFHRHDATKQGKNKRLALGTKASHETLGSGQTLFTCRKLLAEVLAINQVDC
jgi:hypothetical protein